MKRVAWLLDLFWTLLILPFLLGVAHPVNRLEPLSAPGPWSGVSGLTGYGGRVWFVNSVKFVDHNSADIYSYNPANGETRYERHLFSQDGGQPAVANGLLYWPFEDSRSSTGHGEYMVTNGRDWQWRILPDSEVFHVHAMIAHRGTLFAATGAWRGALQRSNNGGITWQVIYDHPTPPRSVSREDGNRQTLVEIPSGVFLMGSDDGEPAERPIHRVSLTAYSIDRFETTNAEFAEFVAATGHVTDAERGNVGWHWDGEWREVKKANWRHPHGPESSIEGLDGHPVVQVSWNDARAYCLWREKRVPTEAEWKRAARGGGDRTYPWGNQLPRDGTQYRASYGSDECCRADAGEGYFFTAPVGSFPGGRSPFGVSDMAGNVWEWVEDTFDEKFYRKSPSANPVNDSKGKRKVIRGGGWGNNPAGLRSTPRHANPPDIGLSMVGFRCAR